MQGLRRTAPAPVQAMRNVVHIDEGAAERSSSSDVRERVQSMHESTQSSERVTNLASRDRVGRGELERGGRRGGKRRKTMGQVSGKNHLSNASSHAPARGPAMQLLAWKTSECGLIAK